MAFLPETDIRLSKKGPSQNAGPLKRRPIHMTINLDESGGLLRVS